MNNNDGAFTKVKKWITGGVGVGVLYASLVFSKNGFQFQTTEDLAWVGWLLAIAATSAQFMMTSDFRKINWSILVLGVASYIYSIHTNIQGFYALRPHVEMYDVLNISGSVFMDIFPEVAISWALGESKLGDLFGNIIKSAQNPEQLTQSQTQKQGNDVISRLPKATQTLKPNIPANDLPLFLQQKKVNYRPAGNSNHNRR
jgi:hypothetical protein